MPMTPRRASAPTEMRWWGHSQLRRPTTPAQAVVVHAAPTPSPAYSGLNKENGMGKEWGKGGGVSGRQKDRGVQPCRRYSE
eukprot:scaffold501_cov105-Isochrysis_galbana.AAC.14